MSNVHKANNVHRRDEPRIIGNPVRYITLQIPVIDIPGDTSDQQQKMFVEKVDEFLHEVTRLKIDHNAALLGLFDIVQVMAGYLLCYTRDNILTGPSAHKYVEDLVEAANDLHIEKIHNYAAERGWHIVRHDRV